MKKKGLLISTIIMVVVLVASLTTATYAWFSATSVVSIEQVALKTRATDGLVIGVAKDASNYVYNECTLAGDGNGSLYWTGDAGLGSEISFKVGTENLQLTVDKACTPLAPSGQALLTAAGITQSGAYVCAKASSSNTTGQVADTTSSGTSGSVAIARTNIDYIDLKLGLAASAAGTVGQVFGIITVTPESMSELAMSGALHVIVKVGDNIVIGDTNFGQDVFSSDSSVASGTNSGFGQTDGTKLAIAFEIYNSEDNSDAAFASSTTTPSETVEIIVWFEGYDTACKNANTGKGNCSMDIDFYYIEHDKDGTGYLEITNNTFNGILSYTQA